MKRIIFITSAVCAAGLIGLDHFRSKLGDVGWALGKSIRDFKRAIKGPESIPDPAANAADGAGVVEPGASARHFDDLSGDPAEARKSLADDTVWGD